MEAGFQNVFEQLRMQHSSQGREYRCSAVISSLYQVAENICSCHGRSKAPFIEACGYIEIGRVFGILTDIRNAVQGHTVLCRPAIPFYGARIVLFGKGADFIPASAMFSCSVSPAAQQKKISVSAKGEPIFRFVQIHTVRRLSSLECGYIGAVLVHLQKIGAVLIEHGKVRGNNDA